jgi:hypothetical protein
MLNSLSAILDKAEAHSKNHKIDPEVLLNYRLAPDMLPFMRQVQIAADLAKGAVARLRKTLHPRTFFRCEKYAFPPEKGGVP